MGDDHARAALERGLASRQVAEGFAQQVADQKLQVETLKSALRKLEHKLEEAHAKSDLLMAQHRRSRALGKASDARMAMGAGPATATVPPGVASPSPSHANSSPSPTSPGASAPKT